MKRRHRLARAAFRAARTALLAGGAWAALAASAALAVEEGSAAGQASRAEVGDYEATFEVGRDGWVECELSFRIAIDGVAIQRGPVLDFLTAYEGPGGLVLDSRLQVLSLYRDGRPEPYHSVDHGGILRVYCGDADVLLEPGVAEYRLRWRAMGTWRVRNGLLLAAFDVTEPFSKHPVEAARVRLALPEGVALRQFTPAVAGTDGSGFGYRIVEEGEGTLTVEAAGPLGPNHLFVLNAVWPDEGFQGRSRWLEVMRQHPRLPLSAAAGGLLVMALVGLLGRKRGAKRRRGHVRP